MNRRAGMLALLFIFLPAADTYPWEVRGLAEQRHLVSGGLYPVLTGFLQLLRGQRICSHISYGHNLPVYRALHFPEGTQVDGAEQAGCLARHKQVPIGAAHDTIAEDSHQSVLLS